MIRQAISCDVCATEMQNPNHWFVVYDRGVELRVIRWGARPRVRANVRHLCGQTCLHKLVDEFMARPASQHPAAHPEENRPTHTEATLPAIPVATTDIDEFESSARLITAIEHAPAPHPEPAAPPLTFVPRASHAEAWKREREREQRATASRRSIA
jgi:hypothetical protein